MADEVENAQPIWALRFRRPDETYLIELPGFDCLYHVDPIATPDIYDEVRAAALEVGSDLPFEPEPEPADPPLLAISDRQFAQQLAILGTITESEALAWAARGDLPDAMESAIAGLPEADRFSARMLLSSATIYEREHPLVPVLGGLLGYDAEAIDELWRAAARL